MAREVESDDSIVLVPGLVINDPYSVGFWVNDGRVFGSGGIGVFRCRDGFLGSRVGVDDPDIIE